MLLQCANISIYMAVIFYKQYNISPMFVIFGRSNFAFCTLISSWNFLGAKIAWFFMAFITQCVINYKPGLRGMGYYSISRGYYNYLLIQCIAILDIDVDTDPVYTVIKAKLAKTLLYFFFKCSNTLPLRN